MSKKSKIILVFLFVTVFLLTSLISSTLFADTTSNIEAFVTRFYNLCLDREPDPSGLQNWVGHLQSGFLSGADVAERFIFSEELLDKNLSNEDFLDIMYRSFFGREPDPEGYAGWFNQLSSGNMSRMEVLAGFVNSVEFANICAKYGIQAGTVTAENTTTVTNSTETTVTEITVIGSEDFKNKTKLAFSLLSDKARNYYDMVLKYVGIIEYADEGSGIYVWENPPRYKVGKATVDAGTIWYAGTIVHDATHSKLYHDYLATHPSESVPEDIYSGEKAEAICLGVQYDALSKIGADQGTLDYVKNVINTRYWEIHYNERWW